MHIDIWYTIRPYRLVVLALQLFNTGSIVSCICVCGTASGVRTGVHNSSPKPVSYRAAVEQSHDPTRSVCTFKAEGPLGGRQRPREYSLSVVIQTLEFSLTDLVISSGINSSRRCVTRDRFMEIRYIAQLNIISCARQTPRNYFCWHLCIVPCGLFVAFAYTNVCFLFFTLSSLALYIYHYSRSVDDVQAQAFRVR